MDSLLISFEGLQRSVIKETVKAELIQYTKCNSHKMKVPLCPQQSHSHTMLSSFLLQLSSDRENKEHTSGYLLTGQCMKLQGVLPSGDTSFPWPFIYSLL